MSDCPHYQECLILRHATQEDRELLAAAVEKVVPVMCDASRLASRIRGSAAAVRLTLGDPGMGLPEPVMGAGTLRLLAEVLRTPGMSTWISYATYHLTRHTGPAGCDI